MNGVRKDHQVVKAKRKQLDEEKEAIAKEIKSTEEKLDILTQKRDEGYKYLQEMKKQREQGVCLICHLNLSSLIHIVSEHKFIIVNERM